MRKRVIQVGVGILLVAFLFTSGVMCVNMGTQAPKHEEQQQNQPKQSQLTYWKEQAAKDPTNLEATANVGHFLLVEAAAKPDGDEKNKMLAEAEQNLQKVIASPSDPNRAFALQEMAKVHMVKKDWAAAKVSLDEALKYADRPLPPAEDESAKASVTEARNTERAEVMFLIAQMQASQDQYREALATLDKLAEMNPPNGIDILFMRAALYEKLGERQKAIAQLEMAEKFATSQEDQFRIMFMKQELMAPASPSPGGSPEAPVSPGAANPGVVASPIMVTPSPVVVTPSPVVASPSPRVVVASPSPAVTSSPSPAPASPSQAASPAPRRSP